MFCDQWVALKENNSPHSYSFSGISLCYKVICDGL